METWPGTSLVIFWLQLSWVSSEDKVIQSSPSLVVQEEDSATLNCSYEVTNFQSLLWFKQQENAPTFLLRQISSGIEKSGRLKGTLDKKELLSTLHITATQLGDSATYLCASNTGNQNFYFGRGTRLTVIPTIENPDPAVYELKSPKSSDISVCLFTDFDSQDSEKSTTDHNMIKLDSTVLNMKAMDSKSNGAVAWSNSSALECNSAFNKTFHSNSEFPCDANLVEKAFETDMNLNFHNLMVIVLRIIFLKVVGFNVLMTLRLWSS